LKRAGAAYDDFVGSLDARVMVSARRFRDLGISAAKELPESLPPTSVEIREPRTPELRVPMQESLLVEAEVVEEVVESPPSLAGSTTSFGETGR
jgi:hypothetical protein